MDTGSREENASKQEFRASVLISIRTDKVLEHDAELSSGFPHHAAFFLGGAPEQFKPLRHADEADVEAGAAGRIIDDRAIDDRVARRDDDLSRPWTPVRSVEPVQIGEGDLSRSSRASLFSRSIIRDRK